MQKTHNQVKPNQPIIQRNFLVFTFLLLCIFSMMPSNGSQIEPSVKVEQILEELKQNKTKDLEFSKKRLNELAKLTSQFTLNQQTQYLYYSALSNLLQGKYEASIELLVQNLANSKSDHWKAVTHSLLSNVYSLQGEYSLAFFHIKEAQNLLPKIKNDQDSYFSVLQHAFNIYSESELLVKALETGRIFNKEVKNKRTYSGCVSYIQLATIEIKTNQFSMAQNSLDGGVKQCSAIENKLLLSLTHELQAKLWLKQNKPELALQLLQKNEAEAKKIGYTILTLRFDLRSSEAYMLLNDLTNANQHALKAYQLAKDLGDKKNLKIAAKLLAAIASKQQDFERSVEYYNEFIELEKEFRIQVTQRQWAYFKNNKDSKFK